MKGMTDRQTRRRPRFPAVWALGAAMAAAVAFAGVAAATDGAVEEGACDPEERICIDVFEDDPEAITARWHGAEQTWIVEPPTGFVQIRHKGDTVTARRMRLREDDQHARLEEGVVVHREDAMARSDALDLWWEREEFLFTGNVMFVQYETESEADGEAAGPDDAAEGAEQPPQNDGDGGVAEADASAAEGEERRGTRTVWADEMRYFGETKNAEARGSVYMEDDQYRVWAQEMVYTREPEVMTFTGDVKVQAADDDWTITGQRFFYDVEAEEGHIVGPHRIQVTPRDD